MGFIIAKYGKKIDVTTQGVKHVVSKHPEINKMLKEIEETLRNPDTVRRSKYGPKVLLYYKFYEKHGKYLSVVVRIFNGEGLFLTSYMTDRIKIGEPYENQQ